MTSHQAPRFWIPTVAAAFLTTALLLSGSSSADSNELTIVPAHEVCMVTDRFFGSQQIPVAVGDLTYFGCCAGCKKTLREKRGARFAIDPVSGKEVDKATAAIGALPGGGVHYFENEGNLKKFHPRPSSKQPVEEP